MDYDKRFKALLTMFFREFMELFFPEFAERIDWRHPPEFLDKELESIVIESGPKTVDLLVKVRSLEPPRSSSAERLCLIHFEVEGRRSREALGKRIGHYINRIDEKFDLPVVPIAVYLKVAGDGIGWQTRDLTCWGHTIVSYHFPYIGLPGLDGVRYAETSNPIALALTGLMNVSHADRARIKGEALQRVEKQKFDARQRALLLDSIDAFTVLDTQQKAEFDQLLKSPQFQKVCDMQKTIYEIAEERGIEKGLEKGLKKGRVEGRQEGRQEGQVLVLERLLKNKFGELSAQATSKLRSMTDRQLGQLAERLMTVEKLSELNLK